MTKCFSVTKPNSVRQRNRVLNSCSACLTSTADFFHSGMGEQVEE